VPGKPTFTGAPPLLKTQTLQPDPLLNQSIDSMPSRGGSSNREVRVRNSSVSNIA
jgi:hypothetical protein